MELTFLYPYWGSEEMDPETFISFCLEKGFSGIEVNFPRQAQRVLDFRQAIQKVRKAKPGFKVVAQQVLSPRVETVDSYKRRLLERLAFILTFEPDMINSHTGKDHFTFEENCSLIEVIEGFGKENDVPVLHEIHRGRFTFHSATLLPYLDRFPAIKLTGDLSHWCLVSESMLEDQEDILNCVRPHIHHLHARVGFEQASQVNDPFAPEWGNHLNGFLKFWQDILGYHRKLGRTEFTITPEFGPFPYMPHAPFDQQPLGDQTAINLKFKDLLIEELTT